MAAAAVVTPPPARTAGGATPRAATLCAQPATPRALSLRGLGGGDAYSLLTTTHYLLPGAGGRSTMLHSLDLLWLHLPGAGGRSTTRRTRCGSTTRWAPSWQNCARSAPPHGQTPSWRPLDALRTPSAAHGAWRMAHGAWHAPRHMLGCSLACLACALLRAPKAAAGHPLQGPQGAGPCPQGCRSRSLLVHPYQAPSATRCSSCSLTTSG